MFDGGHVARLVVLGSNDAGLVLVLPVLAEVNVLPLRVRQSPPQGVEDGSACADVPLLDHGGVDVDVLVAGCHLPHLVMTHCHISQCITKKQGQVPIRRGKKRPYHSYIVILMFDQIASI